MAADSLNLNESGMSDFNRKYMSGVQGSSSYSDLSSQFAAQEAAANRANMQRANQVSSILNQNINAYSPTGSYATAMLKDIERQKKVGITGETQQMISSGLYGTTTTAGLGQKWESSYATPARMKLEDYLTSRQSEARSALASFIERIEQPYPDYSQLLQASLSQSKANASA